MLGRNSTNLAVYIKIKRAAELCWPKYGHWLMKASSVWCAAGGGGVHYTPITLSPPLAKRRGRYQGRTSLGREQTQGCLLSWASQGL